MFFWNLENIDLILFLSLNFVHPCLSTSLSKSVYWGDVELFSIVLVQTCSPWKQQFMMRRKPCSSEPDGIQNIKIVEHVISWKSTFDIVKVFFYFTILYLYLPFICVCMCEKKILLMGLPSVEICEIVIEIEFVRFLCKFASYDYDNWSK